MAISKRLFVVFLIVAITAGCATKSDNIKADSVSPLSYQGYSCDQIGEEMLRIGQKVSEMAAQQDSTATKDAFAMGAGFVFWPSFFFLAAGEDNKKEIARLKGESDALEQIAITKNCTGVLAQRDAALEAWKKEHQEKNETGDALFEAESQECTYNLGLKKSECDRIIAEKMKKEKEKNVAANVSKEPAPPREDSLPQIVIPSAEKSTVSAEQYEEYLKENGIISLLDEETGKEWQVFPQDKRVGYNTAKLLCESGSARLPSFQEFEVLYRRYKGTEAINMFKKKDYNTKSSANTYPRYFSFSNGSNDSGVSYVANVACITVQGKMCRMSAPPNRDNLPQITALKVLQKGHQNKNEIGGGLVDVTYQKQNDFPIVAYDFDAKSGKGTLVVDIQGKGVNARNRVVDSIGKICSDKNVTLISGEETRKGGRYRVLDESVKDGLLTISFEASW